MEVLSINYGYVPSELSRPMSVYLELRFPATHKLSLHEIYCLEEYGSHDSSFSPYINRPFIIDDIVGKRVVVKFLDSTNFHKMKIYMQKCMMREIRTEMIVPLRSICTCGDGETPIRSQTSVLPKCDTKIYLNLCSER